MEPMPTRVDVAADYESFFGLGEMSEREIVGGEMWEGHFGLKILLLANVDRNKFVGVKMKKTKNKKICGYLCKFLPKATY